MEWKKIKKGRYGEDWKKDDLHIVVFYRPDLKLATLWEGNSVLFEKEVDSKEKILKVLEDWKKRY